MGRMVLNSEMKNINKITFILVTGMVISNSCKETKRSFYPTLEDAKKIGAIERGWIPEILPDSTRDIIEQHDLDINKVWIKFKIEKNELDYLLKKLVIQKPDEIEEVFNSNFPVEWWEPSRENIDLFKIGLYKFKTNLLDGKQESKKGYFLLDQKRLVGYYYCCY